MIILFPSVDNPVSQSFYDRAVSSVDFSSISCDCCLHDHCFEKYGFYFRSFISSTSIRLRIQRIRCRHCGRTHAILLSSMVPYSAHSIEIHIAVASMPVRDVLERFQELYSDTAHSIRRRFRKYWKDLIHICDAAADHIASSCLLRFGRQFMQCRGSSLYLRTNIDESPVCCTFPS